MKIIKVLFQPRVITALISALGAIVSACFAGCKLGFTELAVKDFEAEIFSVYNNSTNLIQEVK